MPVRSLRNSRLADFDYRKYYLTEEESEQIFRNHIVPREITGKAEPNDTPVAIFVSEHRCRGCMMGGHGYVGAIYYQIRQAQMTAVVTGRA